MGAPGPLVSSNFTYPANAVSCTAPALAATKAVTLQDTNPKTVATSSYTYDAYGNVTEEQDTDWAGAVIRDVQTVYQYQSNSAYQAPSVNLIHLPYSTILSDGKGKQIAESVWRYDEATSLLGAPGIIGYDGGYTNMARGNMTSSFRWISANFLPTSFSYDIAGNLRSTTDADGHVVSFLYNDDGQNEYAFPTTVTNGMSQTTTIGYDYGAGKATSVKDPLGNTTHYTYNDAFDRVTLITQPSGARTDIAYVTPNWTITFQDQLSADYAIQTQVVYDSFGRLTENRLVLDPDNFIDVAYGYDGLGRSVRR